MAVRPADPTLFNSKDLMSSMEHLDLWLFGDFSIVLISFLLLIAIFIYKKKYSFSFMLLGIMVFLFLFFGLTRLQQGSESVFMSRSRLFVFVPLMIAVLFSLAVPELKLDLKKQVIISFLLLAFVSVHWGMQMNVVKEKIETQILREPKIVAFLPVKQVYELSFKYIAICKNSDNDFILFDGPGKSDIILYITIPLLSENKIRTLIPCCDRRSWYFREVLNAEPEKITVLRNWGEKYDRKPLQDFERRLLSGGDDCMVEYKLKRNIEFTVWFDFQTHLRMHAEQFNKKSQ